MNVLESKNVRIRKNHCCWGCNRTFEKGYEMVKVTGVDGGEFHHAYWCKVCDEYWIKYMEYGDEIEQGNLKEEDFDRWEELRKAIED